MKNSYWSSMLSLFCIVTLLNQTKQTQLVQHRNTTTKYPTKKKKKANPSKENGTFLSSKYKILKFVTSERLCRQTVQNLPQHGTTNVTTNSRTKRIATVHTTPSCPQSNTKITLFKHHHKPPNARNRDRTYNNWRHQRLRRTKRTRITRRGKIGEGKTKWRMGLQGHTKHQWKNETHFLLNSKIHVNSHKT